MADDDRVREELRKRNTAQWKGRRHDPTNHSFDTVQQPDAVAEQHVYLFSPAPSGEMLVWEADLIGDLSPDDGHGRLPPVIHIECPFCTTLEDRRAMTITKENKGYEIEVLAKPYVKPISGPLGHVDLPIRRHLHVREVIQCPYCQTRFTIRGSRIERTER
jgi:uncharacterized Zn-finger protein